MPKEITVKKLILMLCSIEDQDRIVVMSKDAEGNSFSPLIGFWSGGYKDGEVGFMSPEDALAHGYSEDDVIKGKPAIILTQV